MSSVHDLVSAVALDIEASDWRAAISRAGELLVTSGAAGESYTAAMIAVVDDHGPYIVIAPGVAFAHARPDTSVTRTAMSLVRLADPVAFGHDANDPVTLVFALAAVDADAHQDALAGLATLLADPECRQALEAAATPEELREVLADTPRRADSSTASNATAATPSPEPTAARDDRNTATPHATEPRATDLHVGESERDHRPAADTVASTGFILTVCGNGLGTSLFLKNTLEAVLDRWGWTPYVRVEATDTISARGRAKEADVILTSGAIAAALGEVGVPVEVVQDFTSQPEIDAVLRRVYDV